MSKNYSQTGIGSPVEVTKGGPLIRNNAGVLENRNNTDSAFSIMRGAPAVGNDDFVTLAQIGGGTGGTQTFSDLAAGSPVNLSITSLLGALTSPSMVIFNGVLSITPTGSGLLETASLQIIATTDGTALSPASDVVQVNGANALTTISLASVGQSINDFVLQFTVTGLGQTATLTYTTELIG